MLLLPGLQLKSIPSKVNQPPCKALAILINYIHQVSDRFAFD